MRAVAIFLVLVMSSFTCAVANAQQLDGKVVCVKAGDRIATATATLVDPNYRTGTGYQPLWNAAKALVDRDCRPGNPNMVMEELRILVDTPRGNRAMELRWDVKGSTLRITEDKRAEAARREAGVAPAAPKNCGLCTYDDMDCRSSCDLLDQTCRQKCDVKKNVCMRENCF